MVISREIFLVSMTTALVYSGLTLIFPVLPFYLAEFGGGASEFGIAASSFALATFIFAPIIGRVADKRGKVKIIVMSLVLYSITNFLFIFVGSYWDIIILRFFEGISVAGVAPAAISITSDLSEEGNRARSIAFVTAGISFGIIIGPLIGGTLIIDYPLWTPFVMSGILGLIASFFSYVMLDEPENNRVSDQLSIRESRQSYLAKFKQRVAILPKPLLSFSSVVIIQMIMSLSWLFIEPGFVYYFYDDLGYNSQEFGLFVASYGLFVFLGELFLGGISDKIGRKIIIFIGSIIHTVFYLYLIFAEQLQSLLIAAMIAGIGLGLIGPALNALISEVSNHQHRTYVFGVITAFAGIAQIIGPLLGGWMIEKGYNIKTLILISSIMVAISAVLVFLINFDRTNYFEEIQSERYLKKQMVN